MAGRYGMSFARKMIDDGLYEEAVIEATKEIDAGTTSPEILVDRATAYDFQEKYAEAAMDFERALVLDLAERILERDDIDDSYFSALVCAAEHLAHAHSATGDVEKSVSAGTELIDRYARALPAGRHLREAEEWKRRLRGELPSALDKTVM